DGFQPKLPKFGFGDQTSYSITSDLVDSTVETGAVRHGAECFNWYFPQELDPEFLVVWEGFAGEKVSDPTFGVSEMLKEKIKSYIDAFACCARKGKDLPGMPVQ
ncbi:unnamed protein product, partial [Polarella glacialis]